MSALKSIMVVMCPQRRATPALHRAVGYARHTNAVLHLQVFDHYAPIDFSRSVFGVEVADRARRDFLDERMKWLSQQAVGLADQGLRVECEVVWAPQEHEAIVAKVLELKPDLVIKDAAGDSGQAGPLRPSAADWKLLRLCPAPLMLVHPQAHMVPRHLLAAVDVNVGPAGAALNDQVVQAGRRFAALSDAELDLASVFSFVPIEPYGTGFIADTYEIMDNAHKEALQKFAARHKLPAAHVKRCASYDTADGIAACARECHADLVVIGSAYHGGLDRLMFGTTAEALLRHLHCDVLLVKPDGFADELGRHLDLERLRAEYAAPSAAAA